MSKQRRVTSKPKFSSDLVILKDLDITKESLSKQQKEAYYKIMDWINSSKKKKNQIFRFGAVSGFGKTYLIYYLLKELRYKQDECVVMAYTGQAMNVLRANGIYANTIHSSIMIAMEEPVLDEDGQIVTRDGIPLMKVKFKPLRKLPPTVKLIIIDEASFLPEKLESIIKGYGIPILEIGDPYQLPPVSGKQCFNMDNLDFFGTSIQRQEANSEIIQVANHIRVHDKMDLADYHDEVLFLNAMPTIEETFYRYKPFFKHADVIITGTNKQRQILTDLYRETILHTTSPFPIKGERMICRKNNHNLSLGPYQLTNGTQGVAMKTVGKSDREKSDGLFFMDFQPDIVKSMEGDLYYDNLPCDIKFLHKPFGSDMEYVDHNPGEKFEFGEVITAHLVQGATYDNVVYFDTYNRDKEYISRLRYTAITRARKRVIYIVPYSQYGDWTELEHMDNWRL